MRKLTMLAMLLTFPFALFAQKNKKENLNLPPFGTVDKADLLLKTCEFDEKAEAMVLVDNGTLDLVIGRDMELQRRVRIKILNNKGLHWADVHLPYISAGGEEGIAGLEAQTYNLDASGNIVITKVDKKLIYEKKLNKRMSEKVFTFPDVKVGSIIEYKFRHKNIGLIDWYFQRSIPVRYSHFTVDFPLEVEVATVPYASRPFETTTESTSTRNIRTYSMSKVPALRDEPYIINEDYYLDRLETKIVAFEAGGKRENLVLNWLQVINALMNDDDFGVQIKKNIPRTADLDAKLKTVATPYEAMKTVYRYVQENMTWNEYSGIWAFDGVKNAWKDKKGTAGEINLILVNLLKDAGLKAHPVLVSTHENGIVNTMDAGVKHYPGYYQFNKVMAYVEMGNKVYVLDATQKNAPVHLMPFDVLLTEGLVIDKIETGGWGWRTLWNEDQTARQTIIINANVDADGKMKGEASVSSYDYARISRLPTARKGKEPFIEKYITSTNPGVAVEDLQFENVDSDSLPLVQKLKFTRPLNNAGEYQYFSINMLSGIEQNPFVADNRLSDIFFGCKQSYLILGNYNLPEGYEFDELPKNIKMILPDTSITIGRYAQVTGNMLQTRITIDFKKPIYPATQYGELQEFYQRLFEILNEQFVIRKKKKA